MSSAEVREQYVSDGGSKRPFLPTAIGVAVVPAIVLAWLMSLAFSSGFYYFFVLPGLAGLALATVLSKVVAWTHCRNRWLAGMVAGVLGVVTYLGYYQFSLAHALPRAGWRVDLLPRYVMFRLNTDVIMTAHDVGPGKREPIFISNCILCALDLLTITWVPAKFPWKRATYAYCGLLERWMEREKTTWPSGSGGAFLLALETGRLAEFLSTTPPGSGKKLCRLSLEYAMPAEGSAFDYPIYATLTDHLASTSWFKPNLISSTLLRQVALHPSEVLSLQPLFPKLARLLAERHPELQAIPREVIPTTAGPAPAGVAAEIALVASPNSRRVHSGVFFYWTVVLRQSPLLLLCGGLFAAFVAAFLFFMGLGPVPVGIAGVLSPIALVWGAYTGLFCSEVAADRAIVRRLRAAIAKRSGPLVGAQDPHALFVSLIPREKLSTMSMRPADVMLLSIDADQRRLLMEGDCNRYSIPAGSIETCELQSFFRTTDQREMSPIWLVRLMVRVELGLRELLLSVNPTRYTPMMNRGRRRQAEALCRQIESLCAQSKIQNPKSKI
jgi:hypothetical protein